MVRKKQKNKNIVKNKIVQEPIKIIKKISSFSLSKTFDDLKEKVRKAEIEKAKSIKKEKLQEAKREKLELKRQKAE